MFIRMVVFDIAGTVISDADNAVAGRLCDAIRAAGVPVQEARVDPLMGTPKPAAIRILLEEARGLTPDAEEVERIHADFQQRIIAHYRTASTVAPLPGAEALFQTLRQAGIRITFDTGFDRPTTNAILERLGWNDGRIDDTVSSDEVSQGRPSPEMIQVLMQRAGLSDAAAVAKVGDSESDIAQGLAAGCGLVAAVRGPRTPAILKRFPQTPVLEQLQEFPLLLRLQGTNVNLLT